MSGPYMIRAANKPPQRLGTEKKMGWFTRWFDRKCRESWERANQEEVRLLKPVSIHESQSIDSDGMTIRIFSATGGTIAEFRRYDRIKDRSDNKLYVIPSGGDDFGEKFAKIVSMEMMR